MEQGSLLATSEATSSQALRPPRQVSRSISAEDNIEIGKEAIAGVVQLCAGDTALAAQFASLALQMKGKIEQMKARADLESCAAVPFQRVEDGTGNSLQRLKPFCEAKLSNGSRRRTVPQEGTAQPWKKQARRKHSFQQQFEVGMRKENQSPCQAAGPCGKDLPPKSQVCFSF